MRLLYKLIPSSITRSRLRKQFHSTPPTGNVRLRFAPSPTGQLHLGGLRTALYNYLFAKANNGKVIIRIEDTDRTRKIPGAAEKIIDDLSWCGINFDEGPYYQSNRTELYRKHAAELLESGDAYRCFCTPTRLDLLKREAIKSGGVVKYDNACRYLTDDVIQEKLHNNETYCIRFKLTDAVVEFEDMICGLYESDISKVEGDSVILKADGYPTYHLANVVDDHLMGISHVFRGSEWLISTMKHLLMYKAFKWDPPRYGHLPLLLNSDGTKLSKRQGDITISHFRENKIFPNTLLNLVIKAGGGFNLGSDQLDSKNHTLEELIQNFDASRLNKHSCKLMLDRIREVNRLEIRRMLRSETESELLVKEVQDTVKEHFRKRNLDVKLEMDSDHVRKVLEVVNDRVFTVHDLLDNEFSYLWFEPRFKFVEKNKVTADKINALIQELDEKSWDKFDLAGYFRAFAKTHVLSYKDLMTTLRIMLTDNKSGPSIVDILKFLGKEKAIRRLKLSLGQQ